MQRCGFLWLGLALLMVGGCGEAGPSAVGYNDRIVAINQEVNDATQQFEGAALQAMTRSAGTLETARSAHQIAVRKAQDAIAQVRSLTRPLSSTNARIR